MFLKNAWYVACLPHELDNERPLGRAICNERIAFYRAGDGQVAAVDRWQVIQQAVVLAAAALRAMEPRPTPDEAADAMGLLFARSMAALQGALRPTP